MKKTLQKAFYNFATVKTGGKDSVHFCQENMQFVLSLVCFLFFWGCKIKLGALDRTLWAIIRVGGFDHSLIVLIFQRTVINSTLGRSLITL